MFGIKLILDSDLELSPGAGSWRLGQEQPHGTHTSLESEIEGLREKSNLASYPCGDQTCVFLCDIPE